MSGYSVGPWRKAEARASGFTITSQRELIVSSCDEYGHFGPIKSHENANLISAAPDLLDALESLFEIGDVFGSAIEHKDPHCQSFDEWSDKARAAIAKARGEA